MVLLFEKYFWCPLHLKDVLTKDCTFETEFFIFLKCVQFTSVFQSCLTLCDPMDCSTPGLPVHPPTPGACSNSCPSSRWCHPTISSSVVPFSSCPQSFPESGSFPISQLFASGGQSIGASASASVLPMNTQDWFPSGWTGWISLQTKGLSRVFYNTTVQKPQKCVRSVHLVFIPFPSIWLR